MLPRAGPGAGAGARAGQQEVIGLCSLWAPVLPDEGEYPERVTCAHWVGASTRHGEQAPGTTGGEGRLGRLSQEGGELGGAGDSHLHVLAFHMCTP